jgi:hypothetical protein
MSVGDPSAIRESKVVPMMAIPADIFGAPTREMFEPLRGTASGALKVNVENANVPAAAKSVIIDNDAVGNYSVPLALLGGNIPFNTSIKNVAGDALVFDREYSKIFKRDNNLTVLSNSDVRSLNIDVFNCNFLALEIILSTFSAGATLIIEIRGVNNNFPVGYYNFLPAGVVRILHMNIGPSISNFPYISPTVTIINQTGILPSVINIIYTAIGNITFSSNYTLSK